MASEKSSEYYSRSWLW